MNMKNNLMRRIGTRLLSAVTALVMAASLLPAAVVPARAAAWMEPYLEKLVSWGVMRGDSSGNLHPDRTLTRAEFVVLVNRALGYKDTSASVPFRDVSPSDWYYDDINIGHTIGYFKGTSATTASPRAAVTREQAAVLLSRNLALDDDPGASIDFTDSSRLANYSRGLIRSAVVEGILSGYSDGSFRPKQSITRGQMAVLLVKAIGTPVNQSGSHSLGSVYGNVTISTSGVTLRDTTIAGNLYITGGLGLGDVALENVNVLGKIVICGTGESEKGKNSVIMRGVTAPTLIMDNLANNAVSVRAEGSTKIDNTYVRTPAYVEDAADDDYGFTHLRVEGDGTSLSAAGNVKEIVTAAPNSVVTAAKGSVKSLTVDESAAGSSVAVLNGATVKTLNLDTKAAVSGTGDVDRMNVNATGSSASMLPDNIVIRPGVTASIGGQNMDSVLAAESSADPRLLAGYPKITDSAPTSVKGLMRTNKSGTIYWAVTSVTDGSVKDADLIKPSNNPRILKSGNLKAAASNTDYNAAVSGLTAGGSYYFSAVLVDARDQHSAVKTVSFTTPDTSVPNFASGFPYMSKITNTAGEVTVMTTKDCRLYYALLPKGATAPTANDFRSSNLSGNFGYGTREMTKNVSDTFRVNQKSLTELESYDLYLWLTDVDNGKSSTVKKLSFTTVDRTPPVFVRTPSVSSIKSTSVGASAAINEAGTIYWVVVKEGEEYPKPMNGQTTKPELTSEAAKIQVASGLNALKSGKTAATANKDVTLNISGLAAETSYDVYYVAQDKAGNYSDSVGKFTIHTLDTNPPKVTQEFTRTNDTEGKNPLADTDIRIIFSESVQDSGTNQQLLALYQAYKNNSDQDAYNDLLEILRKDIKLYSADVVPNAEVKERAKDSDTDWVIDYRNVEISANDGQIIVTFPHKAQDNGTPAKNSALNLKSGAKYYFVIQDIADTSTNKNIIKPNPTTLPAFTTVFAQIQFSASPYASGASEEFDMSFRVVPRSTENVENNVCWDLLFRMNIPAKFELYEKRGAEGEWKRAGADASGTADIAEINPANTGNLYGASYSRCFRSGNTGSTTNLEPLAGVKEAQTRYYGIRFTSINNVTTRETWSGKVEMQVLAIAGSDTSALHNLAVSNIKDSDLTDAVSAGLVQIGSPSPYTLKHSFSDTQVPEFVSGYPKFDPSDVSGSIDVQLTRTSGKIYYIIAPLDTITTTLEEPLPKNGGRTSLAEDNWKYLPKTLSGEAVTYDVFAEIPTSGNIMTPPYTDSSIIRGSAAYNGSNVSISLKGLSPKTKYVAYFVLQGSSATIYSAHPYVFGFETTEVSRPIITLQNQSPSVGVSTSTTSLVEFVLMKNGSEGVFRNTTFADCIDEGDLKTAFKKECTERGDIAASMSVLDAMSTSAKAGGSLFDVYANDSSKTRFAALIRQSVPNGDDIAMMGKKDVPAGSWQTIPCTGMEVGFTYTFLCVAKSTGDGGSGDAFRAIRPITPKDTEPPYVVSYSLYPETPIAAGEKYTGRLTIAFSKPLYYTPRTQGTGSSDQKTLPIALYKQDPTNPKYMSANLAFTRSPGITIENENIDKVPDPSDSIPAALSEITFVLRGVSSGATIGTTAAGIISDGTSSRQTTPLSLKFSLEPSTDGSGNLIPTVTLQSQSWIAP